MAIVIIMPMFMKKLTRWRRQRRNPNATANLHQRHTLSICCHYHHSRGSKKYQGEEKDKRRCLKFDFTSFFNLSLGQENQTARNSRMFLRTKNRRFVVPLFWSGLKFSPNWFYTACFKKEEKIFSFVRRKKGRKPICYFEPPWKLPGDRSA